MHQLRVVARNRFVDVQDLQDPFVVLAQAALGLGIRQAVHRRDVVVRLVLRAVRARCIDAGAGHAALVHRRLAHFERFARVERQQVMLDDPVLQQRDLAPDLGEEVLALDVTGGQLVDHHADLLEALGWLGHAGHVARPQFVRDLVHVREQLFARGQGLAVGLLGAAGRLDVERELLLVQRLADAERPGLAIGGLALFHVAQEVDVAQHRGAGVGDALREDGLFLRGQDRFLGCLAQVGQHCQRAWRLADRQLGVLARRRLDRRLRRGVIGRHVGQALEDRAQALRLGRVIGIEDQVERRGDIVGRRVPLELAPGGQRPAVLFQLVEQQHQVGAVARRELLRIELAEFFQPFVGKGQLLGAGGRVGQRQVRGLVELADIDAAFRIDAPQRGQVLHAQRGHAAIQAAFAGLRRRGAVTGACTLAGNSGSRTNGGGADDGLLGLGRLLDDLRRFRLALGWLGGGAGRRQCEAGQHGCQRDFRFYHRIRPCNKCEFVIRNGANRVQVSTKPAVCGRMKHSDTNGTKCNITVLSGQRYLPSPVRSMSSMSAGDMRAAISVPSSRLSARSRLWRCRSTMPSSIVPRATSR